MQILATHHLAITTGRFALLREFYVETLGLPVVGGFPDHDIVFMQAGGSTIELIGDEHSAGCALESDRAGRSGWHHLAFEVGDVDAAFAELVDRGVAVHSPPESFPAAAPTMRIAFLADPDGNLVELVQPLGSRYPDAGLARSTGPPTA
jgi:catechol 2,3-dioxygenase-like lactoylglutathione lyase family enzyme